ncbi:unnamed protein product [Ixodes hexagonus]
MLTALKKLVGNNEASGGKHQPPSGMQTMEQSLQKRFARGVQYNMKLVIRGDRNVGKSCLLLRLQGQRLKEEYQPSEEIQARRLQMAQISITASFIQWSYKATDDVVKVEVWDVVDKGKKRRHIEGLKLDNVSSPEASVPEEPALDAEFIDVYKGTNGVIMMLDITKQWTFDYVQRELPKVPDNIPVLVLANHLDMKHHRNITEDQVRFYVESIERPPGSAQIRYAESSLRNGFGLKFLYKWFNLPFLQLQRESLLLQLERNAHETDATNEELDILQESEEQNYDLFAEALNNRRRQVADQLSSASKFAEAASQQTMVNGMPSSATTVNLASETGKSPRVPQAAPPPRSISVPSSLGAQEAKRQATLKGATKAQAPTFAAAVVSPKMGSQQAGEAARSPTGDNSAKSHATSSSTTGASSTPTKQGGLMSKLFKKAERDDPIVVQANVHAPPTGVPSAGPVSNVDDFVPDDGDANFSSFLDDRDPDGGTTPSTMAGEDDSASDDDGGNNPLVTGFQDDVDPEDVVPSRAGGDFVPVVASKESSDEDDVSVIQRKDLNQGEISREDPDGTSSPAAPENAAPEASSFWSMPTEDLTFLEKRYSALSAPATKQPVPQGQPEEPGAEGDVTLPAKPKKHRHKSKKDDKERTQKHRKEGSSKGKEDPERKPRKKSQRKQQAKPSAEDSSSDAERLEAFLGGSDAPGIERATEAYESL